MKRTFIASTIVGMLIAGSALLACPFCSVTSQTLSEEIESSDAVVLARLVSDPPERNDGPDALGGFGAVDPDTGSAKFEIIETIKGKEHLIGVETIEVVFFGPPSKEQTFMISGIGIGTGPLDWTTPIPLSDDAIAYIRKLPDVPPKGAERLAFFQEWLENDDPLLAQDAYDEFARAPYHEVIGLKDRMRHDKLVAWIESPEVSPSRRRLYLTMLGVCGTEADLPMLEEMILSDHRKKEPVVDQLLKTGLAMGGPVSLPLVAEVVKTDERRKKLGLDAMIACYLTLRGPDGLDLIDERFLKDQEVDYTHTYSTLMALRFHGEETDVVPRPRLLESMRLLLNHPDFADQVIPDLARWEDWEVLDRLVDMYRNADQRAFVRQPVVTYVIAASEQPGAIGQRAGEALVELAEIDPESVKRAKSLMAFGFLSRARPDGDAENYTRDGSPFDEAQTDETQTVETATTASDAADIPDPANPEFTGDDGAANLAFNDSGTNPTDEPATPATNTAPPIALPADDVAQLAPPHTSLIVGVPLLAAAVLMGVFWVVLRSGTG